MKTARFSARTVALVAGFGFAFAFGVFAGPQLFSSAPAPAKSATLPDIKNIFAPAAMAGFSQNTLGLYSGYASWPNSATLKSDDTKAQSLFLLEQSGAVNTFSDINGDGLVDILYHNDTFDEDQANHFGIFLNNGNLGFDWVYKCVYKGAANEYYGDCAAS